MRWHLLPASLLLLVLSYPAPASSAAFYSSARRLELRELTRNTFRHAYDSYKRIAFPADEILPISCRPQGHDRGHRDNTGVNDVMGDYLLMVVDSLDTFAIMGDRTGFEEAVREIIQHVSFDVDSRVQVFEVTIRMMGGLLSGHLLATNPKKGYFLSWYDGEMLALAADLGRRLLPAFTTPTGIPWPRVHLRYGVMKTETPETCAAGAGSLLLEFATLSRLTGDVRFEEAARRAFFAIWNRRSDLDLVGNTISAVDGRWMHGISSTGAGIDSFFEYAAKSYVLLGDDEWWRVWEDAYAAIMKHIRAPDGFWYRGVQMQTGQLATVLVDSLSAFFPGVQTLVGDVEAAIISHAVYAYQWKRYGAIPELFDINRRVAANPGYPLRPELIESNLYLYQATGDDFYMEFAEQVLHDLNNKTRTECGFAALKDATTNLLEDKMPSFFTSETLKYLYLTFDVDNPFNHDDSNAVFSTEGHLLELDARPAPKRRRSSVVPSAPVCPAYDPLANIKTQHFLSQSVESRTDFEYARYLAGFVVADEALEIAEGRWSETGWCEVPVAEAYGIDLLYGSTEVTHAKPEQLWQDRDGTVWVQSVAGLRFSLIRAGIGNDAYIVSKIAQYRVPTGALVRVADSGVLASMPPARPEKLWLDFTLGSLDGSDQILRAPALAANFGPSIRSTSAPLGSFAVSLASLSVSAATTLSYGCDSGSHLNKTEVDGKVIVVQRGQCSFALKAHLAALEGAKAVLVVNTADSVDLVPTIDEADAELKALVPLVMISNSTGQALEDLLRRGEVRVRPEESGEEVLESIVLGGYAVSNVRLQRN